MITNKLYVVIAVLAVILTGLFLYLFTIDRRLRKMEQQKKSEKQHS